MKKEIADKWVAALRSGEYQQGTERLHALADFTDGCREVKKGHCCLGVLCEVAIKDGLKVHRLTTETSEYYDYANEALPVSVREYAGMDSDVGTFEENGEDNVLAALNDAGTPFSEIADIIEKYWSEL